MKMPNLPIFVASLVLAMTMWFIVSAENSTVRYVQLEIRLDGLDKNRFFVRDIPRFITVSLRGNPQTVESVVDANAVAVVQFANPQPGITSYPVKLLPERLAQFVQDANPRVNVELEPIIEKRLPVTVETTDKLSESQYVLEDLIASPKIVTVRGPQSDIEQADRVLTTLDLGSVAPNRAVPYSVTPEVLTAAGTKVQYAIVTPGAINVTPTFAPAPIEFSAFVTLDLRGVRAAPGYEIVSYRTQPEQVTVYGQSLDVARVGNVTTAPIRAGRISGTTTITVPLVPPRGVNVRPRNVDVTIEVREKAIPNSDPVQPAPSDAGNPADSRN
ncbi:MAG: CdaR family protein [Fimbriimonadaceae bacterium]|nr:CdaR family protein [Fimbriimonadaceae bacterium]